LGTRQQRIAELDESMFKRQTNFQQRQAIQQQSLNLPLFPTTTIGSFPQTSEIRKTRSAYRKNTINSEQYQTAIQGFIQHAIEEQEQLNLDVLVHGEAERNDMVEYFA
jgi:5-methyltetrahydropteroyltriglutamate--homocysteine methyltransferase